MKVISQLDDRLLASKGFCSMAFVSDKPHEFSPGVMLNISVQLHVQTFLHLHVSKLIEEYVPFLILFFNSNFNSVA
jgi:hypothetical protein